MMKLEPLAYAIRYEPPDWLSQFADGEAMLEGYSRLGLVPGQVYTGKFDRDELGQSGSSPHYFVNEVGRIPVLSWLFAFCDLAEVVEYAVVEQKPCKVKFREFF